MARPLGGPWAAAPLLCVGLACAGAVEPDTTTPPPIPPAMPAPRTPPGRPVAIAPAEVVRRLSELLFRAPPDAAQQAATAMMNLSDSAQVAALAGAMLRDPRAARGIEAFVQHWLEIDGLPGLTKDPVAEPLWNAALAQDMVAEVRRFVTSVVLEGDGRLETLLAAPLAFPNERLAAVYGFAGVTGPELRPFRHDGLARLGILGLPGVITWRSREARTYPSRRGNYFAFRFACRTVFVGEQVDPIIPDRTMRDVQDSHTSYSGCQTCHHLMNPPGWAFEHMGAIGAYRTTDAGLPVDSSGRLPPDLLDTVGEVDIDGLPSLARALAASTRAPTCHALFWLTFAVPSLAPEGVFKAAVAMNAGAPPAGLTDVVAAFQESGQDLRALIAAVASSPQFLAP
jgi:uncharacterized protein DUF1592/uncharacterized protein DUF1588